MTRMLCRRMRKIVSSEVRAREIRIIINDKQKMISFKTTKQ